jgi:O-acetyl-ADP-ribose deacetylase (regulator of RNase III)
MSFTTVGPVWQGGDSGEPELLASCYRRSLDLATQHALETIAFPSISTGRFGYPIELASRMAVTTISSELRNHTGIREVVFCCFSAGDLRHYEKLLDQGHP